MPNMQVYPGQTFDIASAATQYLSATDWDGNNRTGTGTDWCVAMPPLGRFGPVPIVRQSAPGGWGVSLTGDSPNSVFHVTVSPSAALGTGYFAALDAYIPGQETRQLSQPFDVIPPPPTVAYTETGTLGLSPRVIVPLAVAFAGANTLSVGRRCRCCWAPGRACDTSYSAGPSCASPWTAGPASEVS